VGPKKSRAKLLDLGQKYVSSQATGDPQNKLQAQAQDVGAKRAAVVKLLGDKSALQAQLGKNAADLVVADVEYVGSLVAYANAASTFANGDASVLATVGVDEAAKPTKPADEVIVAPVLKVVAGAVEGTVELKCDRVPHAGAFVFEYKLEPSQPTDPWLGNITTKLAKTTVTGLAPAQLVRGRVRAVGVVPGPWSVEVVGRAK
jgi:hypothetical protein